MKYGKTSDTGSQNMDNKKIDWNDFNFPCCLKIFHYDSDETPAPLVNRVRLLRLVHILIIFTALWNFINNCAGAAQGVPDSALRIVISIFSALIWFPLSIYYFYIPYRIYMKEDQSACIFYILSSIIAVFFTIWSIADFADANGWVMLAKNATAGRGAAAFFTFFTAFFSTIIAIITILNIYFFCKRQDQK